MDPPTRMSLESDEHDGGHSQVSQLIRALLNTNAVTRQQPPLKHFRSGEEGYDPLLDISSYDTFATGEFGYWLLLARQIS